MTRASVSTQLAFSLLYEDLAQQHPDWRLLVKSAVACRDWRELHLGLLGQTLEAKYLRLNEWAMECHAGGSSPEQRAVQVLNYVDTLRRNRVLDAEKATR